MHSQSRAWLLKLAVLLLPKLSRSLASKACFLFWLLQAPPEGPPELRGVYNSEEQLLLVLHQAGSIFLPE